MEHCATCIYWNRLELIDGVEIVDARLGACRKARNIWEEKGDLAVLVASGRLWINAIDKASLYTRDDFGCVEWQAAKG